MAGVARAGRVRRLAGVRRGGGVVQRRCEGRHALALTVRDFTVILRIGAASVRKRELGQC